jgi:hypothetical protein
VSQRTVYRWATDGMLESRRIGGRLYIADASVRRWELTTDNTDSTDDTD